MFVKATKLIDFFGLRVGRSYTWDVDVIGEPVTDKTWSITEGVPLSNSERVTIEHEDYTTHIKFTKAQRKVIVSWKQFNNNNNSN